MCRCPGRAATCPRAQGSGNVRCRLFRKNDHSGSGVRSIRGWYGEFREFATGMAIRPWHALDIELSKIFVTTEVLSICLHHGNPIDTHSRGRDSNTKPPAASSSNAEASVDLEYRTARSRVLAIPRGLPITEERRSLLS